MSEKIELQAEVHGDTGDAKDSQEKETPIEQKELVNNESAEGQSNDKNKEPAAVEEIVDSSESQTADKEDINTKEEKQQDNKAKEGVDEGEGGDSEKEAKKEEDSPSKTEEVSTAESKERPDNEEQQPQRNEDIIQQEPKQMATENSQLNRSTESERVAPVCQLARAQASIQAKMRPAMWVPGVRNLHMAREVWEIKATPDECVDKLVAAVDAIPQEELMEISKLDKNRHFVEIFSFTKNCNWLDVVEVTFHTGEEPGTTRGEIVSFSSGLFPTWLPLSFICNCCCFYFPFSGNGQNTRRIGLIKDALQLDVTVRN